MRKINFKITYSLRKLNRLVFITFFILLTISAASVPLSLHDKGYETDTEINEIIMTTPESSDLFENNILYSGIENPLTVNETAIHSSTNHFTIGNGTNSLYSSQYAEFPIDSTHDWEGYYYNATFTNIQDERDWIEQGDMGSDSGLVGLVKTTLGTPIESQHDYQNNQDADPSDPDGTITSNSDFVRVHFSRFEVEDGYDFLYVYDGSNNLIDCITGLYPLGLNSSMYNATILKFSIQSDGTVREWGYSIDYIEEINQSTWRTYKTYMNPEFANSKISELGGASSLGASFIGDYDSYDGSYDYYIGEVGFYEEFIVPRGKVTDAWFSMDYYLNKGLESNDFLIYCKINGEFVYTRGFGTIINLGRNLWHSTGAINLLLWENATQIFNPTIQNQNLNISFGIYAPFSWGYYGGEDVIQQEAFFDNISLVLKTEANCTQIGINLQIDGLSVSESPSWGSGSLTKYGSWDSNPMQLLLSTDAEKLEFDLNSKIYGYHTDSTHEQTNGVTGARVTIFSNDTIQWDSYHNVFVPSQYSEFSYKVYKPFDWNITNVEDPTGLQHLSYIGGDIGENSFIIESDFLGWWYFEAKSDSLLISSSTDLWDELTWKDYDSEDISYDIGDSIRIRTAVSNPSLIGNLLSTTAKITVYYPNGTIYYTDHANPDGSGNIQFSDHGILAANTSGGVYQYKIIWTNGTAAGGLNGSFEIKHAIQHTLLYPRDAILDYNTEAVFGDIIPVRLKLNDLNTGILLSELDVEHNWITGNNTLTKMGSGIYDVSFDTLDLPGVGKYEVDFTVSGLGFYSIYFTLNISIVSETELKIIGLDNNIDYGTNFTIEIDYRTKPEPIGILNALITTNITDYYVEEQVIDGHYLIEINSSSSFVGAGTYDIQINASQTDYYSQVLVTRIQILPRSIYFEIHINSVDCTSNKSYATKIQEDLHFSIGVYTVSGGIPVLTGTVQLSDGVSYSSPFSLIENRYYSMIGSSFFGLGVNFISIIFNETGYQSASEILQISVTRINLDAIFQDSDTMLVTSRDDFSTRIFLKDPRTSNPILNATVTYSWTFGTGFLTEIGEGWYEFSETAPTQSGTYKVTFTITPVNSDYEILTMQMTLVSQKPDTIVKWWWIAIPVGAVIAVLSGSLIAIGVKQKQTKTREQEIARLKLKTQIFDDITNIKGILLIEKHSGLLMYRHVLSGLDEENEELFSGFIRAILLLGKRFIRDEEEIEKGMVFEKKEFIEFTHENFKILLVGGHKIIMALILEQQASKTIREKATKFIEEFEGIYGSVLEGWNGNRNVFEDTTPKLFEEIFNLSLLKAFKLTDNSKIYEKKLITPGSISERVSNVIQTLLEEKESFHLKTIISLIPEGDQLAAKEIILKFIKGKYIIPLD
ncbi:MAG: hypothetical protein JW776_15320 [Candidatus Lokiarchaeota archaeon]|nr:hypothetical protein [Candidatus Lokiarchaeota archaeon]